MPLLFPLKICQVLRDPNARSVISTRAQTCAPSGHPKWVSAIQHLCLYRRTVGQYFWSPGLGRRDSPYSVSIRGVLLLNFKQIGSYWRCYSVWIQKPLCSNYSYPLVGFYATTFGSFTVLLSSSINYSPFFPQQQWQTILYPKTLKLSLKTYNHQLVKV